jgi:hypothetical protein
MKNLCVLLLLVLFSCNVLYAQPEQIPGFNASKADNVIGSSMNHNTVSSANLFTGSASISVPIYEFNKNNIDLGIRLATNTKGVKLNEISGSYGLHWNLSGGGYIISRANDWNDDLNPVNTTLGIGKLHLPTTPPNLRPNMDREYDSYQLSVGGYSFSFYIGVDDYSFAVPHHDVKIERDGEDFIITDIYGNKYYFEFAMNQPVPQTLYYEPVSPMNPILRPVGRTSENSIWVLRRVEFPNSEMITFKYLDFITSYNGYFYAEFGFAPRTTNTYYTSMVPVIRTNQIPILKEVIYPNKDSVVMDYFISSRCDMWYHPLLNTVLKIIIKCTIAIIISI